MTGFDPTPANVHRHEVIRITEMATVDDVLRELVFEDCEIVGPAVLAIMDRNQMRECRLDAGEQLWDVPMQRGYVGAIGLVACLFERCYFRRVGFIGAPETMAQFRAAMGM